MRVTGLGAMRRVLVAVRVIGLGVVRVRVLVATGLGVVRRIRVLVAVRTIGLGVMRRVLVTVRVTGLGVVRVRVLVAETVGLLITRLICLGTTVLAAAILDSAF